MEGLSIDHRFKGSHPVALSSSEDEAADACDSGDEITGDSTKCDPILEEEADALNGFVPRADYVALRSQLELERLQFLRENVALRNEVMRLSQQLESRPNKASAAGFSSMQSQGSTSMSTSGLGSAVATPLVATRDGVGQPPTSPSSSSLVNTHASWRHRSAAAAGPDDGGGESSRGGKQPPRVPVPSPSTGDGMRQAQSPTTSAGGSVSLQLVPFLAELAQGISSASVIADVRALAARQLKLERMKGKASRRRLRQEFAREREHLQRQLLEKEHDRGMLLAGFSAERQSVQHDAFLRVDKMLCDQRRQIEESQRECAKRRQEVSRCRHEIESRRQAFEELEQKLFAAQQQDGVSKQERSEMYHALLQLNKEKVAMENRVTSLQAQLKHSKQELQWLSLTQSFTTNSQGFSPGSNQVNQVQQQQQQQQQQRAPHLPGSSSRGQGSGLPNNRLARRVSHRQSVASMLGLDALLDNAPLTAKLDLRTPRGQQHAIAEMLASTMDS